MSPRHDDHSTGAVREIAFIDPGVAGTCGLVAGLRPCVTAILLDGSGSAPSQIAAALRGLPPVDVVHILAHGRPGEISFAAGVLSLENLREHAGDFTEIGSAVGAGTLNLWSCETGKGAHGSAFVAAIADLTQVAVAAAEGLVGAVALGGAWQLGVGTLNGTVQPPLTAPGMAGFIGVLATITWVGGASGAPTDWGAASNWSPSGPPISTSAVVIPTTANFPRLSSSTTVTSVAISGTDTLTLSGAATVLTVTGTTTLSSSGGISGVGKLASTVTASAASTAVITASGGTLELNTAATLTLTNALAIGANSVKLDATASTLTDAAGIIISTGTITGRGKVAAAVSATGAATIAASGGTLEITGAITNTGGALILTIGAGLSDKLLLDAASSATAARWQSRI